MIGELGADLIKKKYTASAWTEKADKVEREEL